MKTALQLNLFAPNFKPPQQSEASRTTLVYENTRTTLENPFFALHEELLGRAGDDPLLFDIDTWDWNTSSAVGLDVEVYRNYFVVCFKRFIDGKRLAFERSERIGLQEDSIRIIKGIIRQNTIVTFNGNAYDFYILALALSGETCPALKEASDRVIFSEDRGWENNDIVKQKFPVLNHIDLMEPNPSVRMGLKMLAGRLHSRFLVDLPFEPNKLLTPREMNLTTLYCQNDIDCNEIIYKALREPLLMRVALGKRYKADFRSKSDSQIGESIVKIRVSKMTKQRIIKPPAVSETTFTYTPPKFIRFDRPDLVELLQNLSTTVFHANSYGKTSTPPVLRDRVVKINKMQYAMGIGGLHSMEAHRALQSNNDRLLIDVDVASQYPSIICNLGLYPAALGPAFLEVYKELREERLSAKAAGDKIAADGGRIALNGVYGKLGSPYSVLYAPNILVTVTLTGQLSILMLIERAENSEIEVVSANTDGVVFYCPREKLDVLEEILAQWEYDTGFTTERTPYKALYSMSVNTYIAIKEDGKVKRKGPLSDPWEDGDLRVQMSKNPQMTICSAAVVAYLKDGIPLQDTIHNSDDPKRFLTLIRANNGGYWRGNYLGKSIRYYWSLSGSPIVNKTGGRIPKTEGARPLIELPDKLPRDLDYLRYCDEAYKLLVDLGVR